MNKIFSKKLFVEALRQLKVPASLFLGIMLGLSGIMTVSNISSAMEYYERAHHITTIHTMEALIFLPLIFAIAVPIFVVRLFGFLTKRNASDFYHAIPNTRTCIYVSYSAAILCVSLFFVAFGTAIPCIAYAAAGKFISFNTASACFYGINVFACIVLCLGILLLSSSVTGTLFTNGLFALGIMFAPRFIIAIITEALSTEYSEILPYDANFGIFSLDMNNIWTHFMGIFMDSEYIESLFVVSGATLYTVVLGLIYFALGLLAFNKRNSEQAESSAQNPIAHNIIRCGIGFIFVMFITLSFYQSYGFEFIEIALMIFASVFGMIIFELITTKKVKRLLNVAASIPVVAILGVILYFVLEFAGSRILAYQPDASSVKYIQYSPNGTLNNNYDYFNYTTSRVKFDDDEIIQYLTDIYNYQRQVYIDYIESGDPMYDYMDVVHRDAEVVSVRFKEGFTSKERNLYLTKEQMQELNTMISTNEDYIEAFRSLPDNLNIEWGGEIFNGAERKKIIAEYEKDLQNMDPETLTMALSSFKIYENSLVSMEASTVTSIGELYISINVTPDTPNAFAATKEILAKKAATDETKKDIKEICQLVKDIEKYNSEYGYCHVSLSFYDLKNNLNVGSYYIDESTVYDFDSEDSFSTLAYGTFDELTGTLESFITDTVDGASADYLIFVDASCSYSVKDYTENDFEEYSLVFYSNNAEAIEYLLAEEARIEYYGEEIIYDKY